MLHRSVAVAAAGLGGLGLVACGQASASPQEVISRAPARTTAVHTAKVHFAVSGVSALQGQTVSGDGAVDFAAHTATYTVAIPPVGGLQIGAIDAVQTGSVIYEKLPANLAGELGGKPWVKLDLGALAGKAGINLGALSQSRAADPTAALAQLRGASTDIHRVGTETIRGVSTTHYAGTVDLNVAATKATTDVERQAVQQTAKLLGVSSIPVDVWVDGQGRMRREQTRVDLSKVKTPSGQAPPAAGGLLTTTFELYEFGTPVNATAPPADQTTDIAALLGSG